MRGKKHNRLLMSTDYVKGLEKMCIFHLPDVRTESCHIQRNMKQFLIEIPVYLYLNLPSSNEGFIELYYKHVRYYKSYARHHAPWNQQIPAQKYKDNSNVPQVLWHTHNWQSAEMLNIWSSWQQLHLQLNISRLIWSETQLDELMFLYHIQY